MKKLFLTTSLLLSFMEFAQAELMSPQLLKPDNAANLPLKKAAKFTWQKVVSATKYQVVFSADKQFSSYDAAKYKCLSKTTCFTYTVASPAYQVATSHAMLQKDSNYFWQVQAISKTQRGKNSETRSFSVGIPMPPAIENVSASKQQITLGDLVSLKATLDKPFSKDLYSVQISINGSDFQAMASSETQSSFDFKPTEIGEQQFQISIFDKNGEEIDSLGDIFTVISDNSVTIPVKSVPVFTKTTGYTKIANDGSELADSAILGSNPKDWACTKDNKTGLIWEVKTNDGGLHNADNAYSWYEPDANKNGGGIGEKNGGHCSGNCDTSSYVNVVNIQGFCGLHEWRMPTRNELNNLVYCSDGKYNPLDDVTINSQGYSFNVCSSNRLDSYGRATNVTTPPAINADYFPDVKRTGNYFFWSSTTYIPLKSSGWLVSFEAGNNYAFDKGSVAYVRLVHNQ